MAKNDIVLEQSIFPAIIASKKSFWPSKIDLITKCPASTYVDDGSISIKRSGQQADIGSAIHEIASLMIRGDRYDDIEKQIAVKYNVEDVLGDLRRLKNAFYSAWFTSKLSSYFTNPVCEKYMSASRIVDDPYTKLPVEVIISGYADVCEVRNIGGVNTGVVLDWKSGYKTDESGYIGQMKSYAFLLMSEDSSIEEVYAIIVWLRDSTYSTVKFTREEVSEWFSEFIRRSAFWDGSTYCPGDHCSWCNRFISCRARSEMLKDAVNAISPGTNMVISEGGSLVDPDKLYEAFGQASVLKKLIEDFQEQLKEEVAKRGFVAIPSLDGSGFKIETIDGGSSINPLVAWDTLAEFFTDEEISKFISVSSTRMYEILSNKTPRGSKKEAINNLYGKLKAANALIKNNDRKRLVIGDENDE